MAKHRKHKKEYRDYGEYDDISGPNNNFDISNLTSMLNNIDINQVASLLSSLGGLNNLIQNNSNGTENLESEKEAIQNGLQDINIGELISQAANINNSIMQQEDKFDKDKDKDKRKEKKRKKYDSKIDSNEDEIIKLLNAIKSIVNEERAEILERMAQMYKEGKI
ncbi:hypothetical protein [Clostridium ganghwense]|uniref:Uncharacterized protein n=1 Tax=Clostridium ganghwense TaxID=312089 RepID=A0ABT4CKU0_9CLOT|nr:hypothetical protein [Clostridium ganghwense]MCY6369660.1 hypothetical protein [Clostridium ganghwense]